MPDYQKMYFRLFAATAKAVTEIEAMNFGAAQDTLIKAQLEMEEKYLEDEPDEPLCDAPETNPG